MNDRHVLTEIIEEDYLILKDEIIRLRGVIAMQKCFCDDVIIRHTDCLSKTDIEFINMYLYKIRFLYDKFEEIYEFFMKDYPNPHNIMR